MKTPFSNIGSGSPVKVVVPCGLFDPGYLGGGLIRSLVRVVDTADDSVSVHVITTDRDLNASHPYPGLTGRTVERGRNRVTYLDGDKSVIGLRVLARTRAMKPDIIYINDLWDRHFGLAVILGFGLRILRPTMLLVSPRGSLSPGALGFRSRAKLILLQVFQWVLNRDSVVFHASARLEEEDIRRYFPRARILIVEDQVELPPSAMAPPVSPDEQGPLRCVFISRISPKKNLKTILESLPATGGKVILDIWGPVEDSRYWQECWETVTSNSMEGQVTYRGLLKPDEVVETFADYELFAFPTLGENFGHVIAESLAASCPVMCSELTPWTEVLSNGGGVITSNDVEGVTRTLSSYGELSGAERMARRLAAGRAYESWRKDLADDNVLHLAHEMLRAGKDTA